MVKLDSLGNIQWQNTIGGTLNDIGTYVKQFQDSTYIVVATSSSDISGDMTISTNGGSDIWVLKLDVNGNLISQNQYGGNADDISWNAKAFSNKDVYIAAYSSSGISGNKTEQNYGSSDYWIFKIDSVGTLLWQNTIVGSGGDITMGIDVNSAGESFIAGRSSSPMSGEKSENSMGIDYWIVKLNATGDLVWENTIGGSSTEDTRSILANSDGSCVAAGVSNSPISGDKSQGSFGATDFWIVKIEGPGNSPLPLDLVSFTGNLQNNMAQLQWETANMVNVKGFDVEKSTDAKSFTSIGFVNASTTNAYSFTDTRCYDRNNYYRLKMIDIDGQYTYSKTINLVNTAKAEITIFPNPVLNELNIVCSIPNYTYTILDMYGHEILKVKSNSASVLITGVSFPKGIYFLKLETTTETKTMKFVKE